MKSKPLNQPTGQPKTLRQMWQDAHDRLPWYRRHYILTGLLVAASVMAMIYLGWEPWLLLPALPPH